MSRFYAFKEVRKGLGGSDSREPVGGVELTHARMKRIISPVSGVVS